MNKMMTSMLAIGAGVAAYNYVQKNNLISGRQKRRLRRGMKSIF
ncbi:YrzQ family protein [Bacillus sp. V3B]|nr:YrzQ family protein [Bacillus sp. V3B]MCQ6273583.1 YrzQ family protein [Bacillus sp. V3B]